jgi:RNA methyltransferase, TrmH family
MTAKQKLVHALANKKQRDTRNLFVGEGTKTVGELLRSFRCVTAMVTAEWADANQGMLSQVNNVEIVTYDELRKTSLQKTPQGVIGVFSKGEPKDVDLKAAENGLCLALDSVQDPGNLGTIIRLANWFGMSTIVCSKTTADVYSPKVVQATMGALAGIDILYTDLRMYLESLMPSVPIYGTFLDGTNVYDTTLSPNGVIVMGNEGNGISAAVAEVVTKRLYIPPYNANLKTTESLNVGVAAAVICAEFRRRFPRV